MLFALQNGVRVKATPGAIGVCPCCDSNVHSKCGSIKVWHWAHVAKSECDKWAESEGYWHLTLKNLFPEDCREVTVEKNGIRHRADVKINGVVIELQSSPIKPEVIEQREAFYGNMFWILDGNKFIERFEARGKDGYHNFTWKYAKKSFLYAKKPVFIAFGDRLFLIRNGYERMKYGWGVMTSLKWFLEHHFKLKIDHEKYIEDFKKELLANEKKAAKIREYLEKMNDLNSYQ